MTQPGSPPRVPGCADSGMLVLADGTVFRGRGWGKTGRAVGEVCFNTSMSGYQEVMTDPSYAGQIITFTFPAHRDRRLQCDRPRSRVAGRAGRHLPGRSDAAPSNWRSEQPLDAWLREAGIVGLSGIDTRALTLRIRAGGAPCRRHCARTRRRIRYRGPGERGGPRGRGWQAWNLAREVTCREPYTWTTGLWSGLARTPVPAADAVPIVAVDYGVKRNILRLLVDRGLTPTVVPATESAEAILARRPAGIFLSNGPGDPAATAEYAVPGDPQADRLGPAAVRNLPGSPAPRPRARRAHREDCTRGTGARTSRSLDRATGKVEITSQNHGFVVCREGLPETLEETHTSLFDGSIEGIRLRSRPVSGVQYHPEASPGPRDLRLPVRPVPIADRRGRPLMPRRPDIESILVVGAGPIVIGQACEFDYSGSQACKVLRDEGYQA